MRALLTPNGKENIMKSVRTWLAAFGFALEALGFFSLSAPDALAANVTSTWSAATSGAWNVNANWTNVPASGGFPNNGNGGVATYDAVISPAGSPYTVTLNTDVTVEDLSLNSANATLSHTAGTLTATGAINLTAGTFQLNGGTIANTTVNVGGGTLNVADNAANLLTGVTVNGDLTLNSNSAHTKLAGGTTFNTAHLAEFQAALGFAPGQTLSGTILFEGSTNALRAVEMNGTAGAFTVGPMGVIRTAAGFGGNAQIGGAFFTGGAMALTNNGLISSQTSGRTVTVNPDTLTNGGTGILEAKSGGILTIAPTGDLDQCGHDQREQPESVNLGGTFNATGGIGAWSNTAGTVNVTGTVNAGSGANTLTLNNSTGSWTLNGGTISGGALAFADGKTLNVADNAANLLTGVTVNGDLTLNSNSAHTKLAGGTTFNTAHLAEFQAALGFAPGQTLSGTILFEGSTNALRAVEMNGTAGAFTVGPMGVIRTAAGFGGNAQIGGAFFTGGAMALTNNGLISSQTSGRTVTVNPDTLTNGGTGILEAKSGGILTIAPTGTWTNAGTISVNAGIVNLGGTFNATGGIGAWSNTAGTVNVTGTVNAGSGANTLTLNNSTGSWTLNGGTISGGALAFADGKTLNVADNAANLLTGVTVNGDLTLNSNSAHTKLAGGTTFNTAHLAEFQAALGFAPGQTLSGTILFEGSTNALRAVEMNGTAGAFTVGPTGVIRTAAGFGGDAQIGAALWTGGAMALTNNGLISSQTSGRTVTVNPATSFANGGTLEAVNGGILAVPLGYTQTAGTTRVSSGGTISAIDPLDVNTLHTITVAGGRLEGSGTITANVANSATIAPGLSAGSLSIAGDLILTAASTLQIEIGGVRQGVDHDFLSEAGAAPLNLAGALSVVRVGGFLPTAADSLIILSSNQPITGMFSNVVGGRVTATDGITSIKVSVVGNYVVLGERPGDYNGNGVVDGADFLVWQQGLGGPFTPAHLDVWNTKLGTPASSIADANRDVLSNARSNVPEPATAVMLIAGMLALRSRYTRPRRKLIRP